MGIAKGEHLREGANDDRQKGGAAAHARILGGRSMIVVGAIAALGLYQAFTALMPRPSPDGRPPNVAMNNKPVAPAAAIASSAVARADTPHHRTPASHPAHRTPPRRQLVTKCIHDGGVSFTDAPCETGARTEVLAVHPDRNLTEGLLPSQVQRSVAAEPNASRDVAVADADPDALRRNQCDALQARVRAIDERAGEPLGGPTQDQLADLRREYRDAQFRLRC